MSDWAFLNKHRVTEPTRTVAPQLCSDASYGFNGMYRFPLDGHLVRCIAGDGEGWEHVSVTLEREHKSPTWAIMAKIKDLFWEPDQVVVQFHPRKADYVNWNPHCLHLWRCLDREFPTPDPILVGPKTNER